MSNVARSDSVLITTFRAFHFAVCKTTDTRSTADTALFRFVLVQKSGTNVIGDLRTDPVAIIDLIQLLVQQLFELQTWSVKIEKERLLGSLNEFVKHPRPRVFVTLIASLIFIHTFQTN